MPTVPFVLLNDLPFNVGNEVDQLDIEISDGVNKEIPVINKPLSSVAGRVTAGNNQYISANGGFTRTSTSVILQSAPINGTPIIIPGIIRFNLKAYDQETIEGYSGDPNITVTPFWICDPLTIALNTYVPSYLQPGIRVMMVDNDLDNGALVDWIELGYGNPVTGEAPSASLDAAPVITQAGAAGTSHMSYVVAAYAWSTLLSISAVGSTVLGNATQDSTNYNVITWSAVVGATSYKIWRTATNGTAPTTVGLIATTSSLNVHDTGLAGNATTPPTSAWVAAGSPLYFPAVQAADALTAAVSVVGATSITVGSGALFALPALQQTVQYIRIDEGTANKEDLQIVGISGNVITTTPMAFTHAIGATVYQLAYGGWARLTLPTGLGPLALVDVSTDLLYDIGAR